MQQFHSQTILLKAINRKTIANSCIERRVIFHDINFTPKNSSPLTLESTLRESSKCIYVNDRVSNSGARASPMICIPVSHSIYADVTPRPLLITRIRRGRATSR